MGAGAVTSVHAERSPRRLPKPPAPILPCRHCVPEAAIWPLGCSFLLRKKRVLLLALSAQWGCEVSSAMICTEVLRETGWFLLTLSSLLSAGPANLLLCLQDALGRLNWHSLPLRRCSHDQIRPRWQQIKSFETCNESVQRQKLSGSTNKRFCSVHFGHPLRMQEHCLKRISC